jgi:hypothetical protein
MKQTGRETSNSLVPLATRARSHIITNINRHLGPVSEAAQGGIGFVKPQMASNGSVMNVMKKEKTKVRELWYAE